MGRHSEEAAHCEDGVAVLLQWVETGGAPYWVPCGGCTWSEEQGPDLQHSMGADGQPCTTCGGTGWKGCATLADSPWVIDDFTVTCANLQLLWLGQGLAGR